MILDIKKKIEKIKYQLETDFIFSSISLWGEKRYQLFVTKGTILKFSMVTICFVSTLFKSLFKIVLLTNYQRHVKKKFTRLYLHIYIYIFV